MIILHGQRPCLPCLCAQVVEALEVVMSFSGVNNVPGYRGASLGATRLDKVGVHMSICARNPTVVQYAECMHVGLAHADPLAQTHETCGCRR